MIAIPLRAALGAGRRPRHGAVRVHGRAGAGRADGAADDGRRVDTASADGTGTADGTATSRQHPGVEAATSDAGADEGQADDGAAASPVTVTCLSAKEASAIAGVGVDLYPDDTGWCTYEGAREVDATTMAQVDLIYGPATRGRTAVEDGWTAEPRLGPTGQTQLADTGYSCRAAGSAVEAYASGSAGTDLCEIAVQLVLAGAEASDVQP